MRKLAAILFSLLPAAAFGQFAVEKADQSVEKNGMAIIAVLDTTAPQAEGTTFSAPCTGSGNGAPTFRAPCLGDPIVGVQAAFPGTAQSGNAHLTGTVGADTGVTLASGGILQATSLSKLVFVGTDGRAAFTKATKDNSFRLWLGCDTAAATCMAVDANATGPKAGFLQADGNAGEFYVDGMDYRGALKNNAGSPYTLTLKESQINCDTSGGAVTLNLPASPNVGHFYRIAKSSDDTTACTITPNGSDRIGAFNGSVTLVNRGDYLMLYDRSASGMHWQVVGGNVWNSWGGTAAGVYTAGEQVYVTPNGAQMVMGQRSENITLSTSGLTTQSTNNLIPGGSIIDAVVVRVTTTITTTTNWAVGDATTTSRFCAANSTKTGGTTATCLQHWNPAAATTLATGPTTVSDTIGTPAADAKVQITCTGSNPGAGAIRVTVFYHRFVAPTS